MTEGRFNNGGGIDFTMYPPSLALHEEEGSAYTCACTTCSG